jgi:hypothetical protein
MFGADGLWKNAGAVGRWLLTLGIMMLKTRRTARIDFRSSFERDANN